MTSEEVSASTPTPETTISTSAPALSGTDDGRTLLMAAGGSETWMEKDAAMSAGLMPAGAVSGASWQVMVPAVCGGGKATVAESRSGVACSTASRGSREVEPGKTSKSTPEQARSSSEASVAVEGASVIATATVHSPHVRHSPADGTVTTAVASGTAR
eukprot:1424289-Rhodomonas_salina.1